MRIQAIGAQAHKLLVACVLVLLCPYTLAGQITVFFTGNELGQLKPCGCSGGQLGGLDRRYAVFSAVKSENRLILDTGSLVIDSSEQNLIKLNVIVQAYNQLGYDIINLTEKDISIATQAGLLDVLHSGFSCISPSSTGDDIAPKFTKEFTINGDTAAVTVITVETEEQIARLPDLVEPNAAVNILIFNSTDAQAIEAVAQMGLVDCMLVAPQSDEPTLENDPNARPLIIMAGRIGKYVGKIDIAFQDQLTKPKLTFSSISVTEELPLHQPLVELYKDYQRLLKEANLLDKFPRFVLPDNLYYTGSKSCKLCHDYEYKKWMTSTQVFIPSLSRQADKNSRHSDAWSTLVDVNSDYDPECVICHVVGMKYQTGFITPEKTPKLVEVGCEECHGPGSEHVRTSGVARTSGPMSTCTDCHTPEHSANYAGNENQYYEKTIHWRIPTPDVNDANE